MNTTKKNVKILSYFIVVIFLSSCGDDKNWSDDEIINKYINLFIRDKNTIIEYFNCEIIRFFKTGIETGDVWSEVYWIVSCNYNNKKSGTTYYIDSNSYLLFKYTF